jgi:hypothetical protein
MCTHLHASLAVCTTHGMASRQLQCRRHGPVPRQQLCTEHHVCFVQMVVLTVGQMMKPELAVESPMAKDPMVSGAAGAAPSEGFTGMLADFEGIQQRTNNSLTKGYFMDGGALITGYNGCVLLQLLPARLSQLHNHGRAGIALATSALACAGWRNLHASQNAGKKCVW